MSSLYHVMLKLSCRPVPVKNIRFAHPALPGALSEHKEVWGIEPQFGCDSTAIRIGREVLEYPVVWSDARLRAVFEIMAEEARAKLVGQPFSDKLYAWMLRSMPSFLPSLHEAAGAFRMSARTLQAKLNREGTSFNRLVGRVRQELAALYLSKPEYTVGEIAYLLHYSEPSAFQNAFKKWTGLSPGQYRTEAAHS